MKIFYFETSAINYLWANATDENIEFIRKILSSDKDCFLTLSPVSAWEILSTPDLQTRDELVRVCQLLFDEFSLFPSPVKILDTFIERGCKLEISLDGFFNTDCWISKVWREVATNKDKTILVEDGFPKEDKEHMKRVSRILRDLIKNKYTRQDGHEDEYYNPACDLVNTMYNQVEFIQDDLKEGDIPEYTICLYKTAIFFAVCLLILGIHTDYDERINFWNKRNISNDIREQLCYLFHQNGTILHRGPLVYMASMAISEVARGTNRGLYKDCLHAVYMPYCTSFFTRDKHFVQMANDDTIGLWNRVVSIERFCEDLQAVIESLKSADGIDESKIDPCLPNNRLD